MINNKSLIDLLFPKKCLVCRKAGSYLCRQCREETVLLKLQTHRACRKKFLADGLVSLYQYRFPLNRLLKDFKYYQVRDLRMLMVDLTVSALIKQRVLPFWKKNNFVFIPMPLFPARCLWRGFNQSEVILETVCQQLNLKFDNRILIRSKWTKEQAKLSGEERRKNIINAFQVLDEKKVMGNNFVVFDDVYTSGSSLKEAIKTLKSSGAMKVWGLTLCR